MLIGKVQYFGDVRHCYRVTFMSLFLVFAGNGIIYENGKLVGKTRRFSLDGQIAVADIDIASLRRERQANEVFAACARNYPFERVRRVVASPFLHRLA